MYNLELLKTTAEVEPLLRMAKRDKRRANVRKETLDLRNEDATDSGADRAADILAAEADLEAANRLIESLPDGLRKNQETTKKMAIEVRLRRLKEGDTDDAPSSIVERSYDVDLRDRELAGIDAFIAALEARKAELA
jgi:hypothetical protein